MNTYKDDPSRGLSKLQKAILGWVFEKELEFLELVEAYKRGHEPEPRGRADWSRRSDWGCSRQAASRSRRRLEQRGLLTGGLWNLRLTEAGQTVAEALDGTGDPELE